MRTHYRGVLTILAVFMLSGIALSLGQGTFSPILLSGALFLGYCLIYWLSVKVAAVVKIQRYKAVHENPKVKDYISKLRAAQSGTNPEKK